MEEVSAERLARELVNIYTDGGGNAYLLHEITKAINKATAAKNRELEAACKALEYSNHCMDQAIQILPVPLKDLLDDPMACNQALIDQIRLER